MDEIEYLFTPTNAPSKDDRTLMRNTFPEYDTHLFQNTRKSNLDGFVNVIVTSSDGGNLYTAAHLDSVISLNQAIINITSSEGNHSYNDVCAKWKGVCYENNLIAILNGTGHTINTTNISYPLHNSQYFLTFQLGSVSIDSNGHVVSAKAVFLSYYMKYVSAEDAAKSDKWIATAKTIMSTYSVPGLVIHFETSLSLTEELEASISGIIPRFSVTYIVLMTFCVLTCMMTDWVSHVMFLSRTHTYKFC